MNDLAENNLIRFKNISKKKETMYANFQSERPTRWRELLRFYFCRYLCC